MTEDAEAIWRRVRRANDAWTGGRPLETASLFHPDVVMLSPSGEIVMEGRDAMVESFVAYCERATTHAFRELEHRVRLFGGSALLTYAFEVEYELDGERRRERGRELLVFARNGDAWRAVSRMQLPGRET